jgi:hypothetical protein
LIGNQLRLELADRRRSIATLEWRLFLFGVSQSAARMVEQ